MTILIVLFICGVALAVSRAASPTWNVKFEKAGVGLIQAIGVILQWGIWISIGYFLLAAVGIIEWPDWTK